MSLARRMSVMVGMILIAAPIALAETDLIGFEDREDLTDFPARWGPVMDLFNVPGISVAVVKDGVPYAAWSAGFRDLEGNPIDQHTVFYIASMTKVYLAAGICKLVDEGKLALDDRVKDHLPQLKLPDEEIESKVTIRDLLCHRYGINSSPAVMLDAYTGDITDDRYFYWLARGEVRGEVAYTNVHFTILGRVIEAIAGKGWRDYLDEAIFEPAGMHRTTGYASELYGWENSATPLERIGGGAFSRAELVKDDSVMHAAGGMGTTAFDAARWLSLQMKAGEIDGSRIISAELIEESHTIQSNLAEPRGTIRIQNGFGLGWMLGSFNERPIAMHGGGYLGTSTYFAMLPEDGVGVVVLINGSPVASMLGDIVAVDVLARLTDTEPAWDVFANYVERATKRKALEGPFVDSKGGGPFPISALSRGTAAYLGTYVSEHLGTVRVMMEGENFLVNVGKVRSRFQDHDVPDHFLFDGPAFDGVEGWFEFEGERVVRVVLSEENLGEMVFERR